MFLDARIVYDYGRVVPPFLVRLRSNYISKMTDWFTCHDRQSAIRVMYLPVTFENKCDVSSITIELKVDVQYIYSGINIVKFSDNSLLYWCFGQLWTNNAPYVTNDETVIWVHIWQSARKQNFSHAFSMRLNHIESIVNVFLEQSRTMSLVILQSCFFVFFFHMKQKNRLESNLSVIFSKWDRIG